MVFYSILQLRSTGNKEKDKSHDESGEGQCDFALLVWLMASNRNTTKLASVDPSKAGLPLPHRLPLSPLVYTDCMEFANTDGRAFSDNIQ